MGIRNTITILAIASVLWSGCAREYVPPATLEIEKDGMNLELCAWTARPDRFKFRIREVNAEPVQYIIATDTNWAPELPRYLEPFDFDVIDASSVPENHPLKKYLCNDKLVELFQEYRIKIDKDDLGIGY